MSSAIGWVGVAAVVGSAAAGAYAANKQAGAANNATNLQGQIYGSTVDRNAPFVQQGQNAVGALGQYMGTAPNDNSTSTYGQGTQTFNASDLNANMAPNYAFQLQQGQQQLDRSGLGQGNASGNFFAGAQNFTQGTAAGAYQQAYNNFNANQTNIYNRLSGLAGLGQASANTTAQAGSAAGQGMASTTLASGAYTASGINGAGNSLASLGYLNALNGGNKSFNNLTPSSTVSSPPDYSLSGGSNGLISGTQTPG